MFYVLIKKKIKWANENNICFDLPPHTLPLPNGDIINNKSFTRTNLSQNQKYLSPYLRRLVEKYKRIHNYVVLELFRQLNQDFYQANFNYKLISLINKLIL